MQTTTISSVDEYIATYPKKIRPLLTTMRQTIQKAAPDANEKMSYGIPTYYLRANLVHFGAFKNHISFFPTGSGVAAFKNELGTYAVSKGTIHFPLDKPLPLDLITKIVKFRVEQNLERGKK